MQSSIFVFMHCRVLYHINFRGVLMTYLCCMCWKEPSVQGKPVCYDCEAKGKLALVDAQKRERAAPIPQYERD